MPELRRAFEAARQKSQHAAEHRRSLAWTTAVLTRTSGKHFPTFEAFVIGKTRRQTPAQMRKALMGILGTKRKGART